MKAALFALILVSFSRCEVVSPESGEVSGRVTSSSIMLTNETGASVYFFVVGRGTAAFIQWAPIMSEENEIRHGRSREIRIADVYKADSENEVIVYWWQARWLRDDLMAGDIHGFNLTL